MENRFKRSVVISQRPSKCSVVLSNIVKTHNNETILNGVNLIAYSGKICAILGGMKSGKSVLLSCIVGLDKIDKGEIWVLGGQPRTKNSKALTSTVGYMPQEICMYNNMTILELFNYFSQLYNIYDGFTFTQWRLNYYNDIFTLPPTNISIEDLSFSQKRLVSFLLSVYHRPRLLVLDEPTVGLDFFKQHKIWKYLNHLCNTWKPTVIIATNSIKEAFLATKIAYIKNGKIIFEKEIEELQNLIPNKPINIIIEDLCNNSMSDLDLTLCKKIKPRSDIWKLQTLIFNKMKFITKKYYSLEYLAKDSVKKRFTMGFMRVPQNYTNTIIQFMAKKIIVKEPDTFSISGINIEIDMTTYEFQEHFKQQLFNSHQLHLADIYSYYNLSTNYANIPIKVYEYANLNPTENTVSGIISW
ncbi:ABC transporter G family member 23-like [Sipha flava]|uniref:ABC transporter G family member 23-like n=1 Tax=Sipha flava TaxID=143950 RepID=A0A8B8FTQ9_9HEMI|nr:ABC transporter G family member 23-like [Sipha flava]